MQPYLCSNNEHEFLHTFYVAVNSPEAVRLSGTSATGIWGGFSSVRSTSRIQDGLA